MNFVLEAVAEQPIWLELIPVGFGAVLGATAAAIPAIWLAKRERKVAQQNQNTALAYSISAKLLMIANSTFTIKKLIDGMVALPGPETPISEKISVVVGLDDSELVAFSSEELTFSISEKKEDLFNDAQLLSRLQHTLFAKIRRYNDLKESIRLFAEERAEMREEGQLLVHRFSPSDAIIFRMKNDSIEIIALSIVGQLAEMETLTNTCIEYFQENMGEYFDSGHAPMVEENEALQETS